MSNAELGIAIAETLLGSPLAPLFKAGLKWLIDAASTEQREAARRLDIKLDALAQQGSRQIDMLNAQAQLHLKTASRLIRDATAMRNVRTRRDLLTRAAEELAEAVEAEQGPDRVRAHLLTAYCYELLGEQKAATNKCEDAYEAAWDDGRLRFLWFDCERQYDAGLEGSSNAQLRIGLALTRRQMQLDSTNDGMMHHFQAAFALSSTPRGDFASLLSKFAQAHHTLALAELAATLLANAGSSAALDELRPIRVVGERFGLLAPLPVALRPGSGRKRPPSPSPPRRR